MNRLVREEQSKRNAIECALVNYLVGEATTRLTDSDGERHAPPWDPKQQVRVGVLNATFEEETDTDEDADKSNDIDRNDLSGSRGNPVSIGFDFIVDRRSQDALQLCLDVQFALYQPLLPTFEEMTAFVRDEKESECVEEESTSGGATDTPSHDPDRIPVRHAWLRTNVAIDGIELTAEVNGEHYQVTSELDVAVEDVVHKHFERPDAARPFAASRTVPVSSLSSEADWKAAVDEKNDETWEPRCPLPRIVVFAEPIANNRALVSVSLINETTYGDSNPFQDLSLYDCQISTRVGGKAALVHQQFDLAPDDYRFHDVADVVGQGRNCVAVATEDGGIASSTVPVFVQPAVNQRSDHVPSLKWADLSEEPDPILAGISDEMRKYLQKWDRWLREKKDDHPHIYEASKRDRDGFAREIQRFDLGREMINRDRELFRAFCLANDVFARINVHQDYDTWRLFQLVYIVSELPSLAAREHREDDRLRRELDHADVLWFPTGGGKTEAYLGLIAVALFYDRLRGKSRGVSAWLRFPLRMLSVQQLGRVLEVIAEADQLRMEKLSGVGAAFELGYLVGSSNTPNQLKWPKNWWPGIDRAHTLTDEALKENRLVAACPYCSDNDSVRLEFNEGSVRLLHRCIACERSLPIHMTDDEVYRYQPSVIVSTIDKITGFAHFGEFTSFNWGPKYCCPEHGYFSFNGCLAGDKCERSLREMERVTEWVDPAPALLVQDELHLVREELGTFNAHFEGMIARMQEHGPSGLASKMLAATATIEQYQDQLRQIYGRKPRRFPSPGYERGHSFYTRETPDIRRVFLGIMPTGGGMSKVDAAAAIHREMIQIIQDLQDDLSQARELINNQTGFSPSDKALHKLLFNYEVSLTYVNSKAHGANIADAISSLNESLQSRDKDVVRFSILTGEVPISELAAAINLIEEANPGQNRSNRLRAIVGTSVISHGVDLSRLNVMMMTGMPSTIADYIQATSRSGRTHAGLVVTLFDHFSRREASIFSHFDSTHIFLDRLVEPVPVNRYAKHSTRRTLPAIVVSLLWHLLRDPSTPGLSGSTGIKYTRHFQPWWNAHAATLMPKLTELIEASYRAIVEGTTDPALERDLVEAALHRWEQIERPQMESFSADRLKELFREPVMTSLRDVDEAVEFGAMPNSARVYEALMGRPPS